MIDISCSNKAFENYVCLTPVKFGFRVDDFQKIVKRAIAANSVELRLDGSLLEVRTSGVYAKNYRLKLIESKPGTDTPLPRVVPTARLVMKLSMLKEVLSDIEAISNKITIESTPESKITFSTDGESGDGRLIIDGNAMIEGLSVTATETAKATFTTDLISKMVEALTGAADLVTISYSSDKPLNLSFTLSPEVNISFFLAPRVVN
jgi:hypothetical protein